MRTMHGALAAVAERLGLAQIMPDVAGYAEIVVADVLPVFLRIADEHELELSARLNEFDGRLSPALLEELMRWNGRFVGLRFAVEPDRPGVVLGQRLDIRIMDDARLSAAIDRFILAVADWRRSGAEALLQRVMRYGTGDEEAMPQEFRL